MQQSSNKRSVKARRRTAATGTKPVAPTRRSAADGARTAPSARATQASRARRQNAGLPVLAASSAGASGGMSAGTGPGAGTGTILAASAIDAPPERHPAPAPRQQPRAEPTATDTTRRFAREAGAWGRYALRTAGQRIRGLTAEQWLWIAVLGLAVVLRFWGLGDKPLHHDESMHAYFSLQFALNPSSYAYDPLLHGPFQFHAEGLMFAFILGLQHIFNSNAIGNPWINDTTARFVPALFGIGIVALPIWLRRELGRTTVLIAAFLLAISPAFVYFARFLREDVYFNFFMFAMVVCAVRFARARTMKWFVLLCAATVLAYSTFEGIFLTLVIFFGFLAALVVWELAVGVARRMPDTFTARERTFFSRLGLFALFGALAAIAAYIGLKIVDNISMQIFLHTATTDAQVANLENVTVSLLLIASILIALGVIAALLWQIYRDTAPEPEPRPVVEWIDDDEDGDVNALGVAPATPVAERIDALLGAPGQAAAALRDRLDPEAQPFLRLLLSISWMQWFVGFVVGWMIFAALYWIIPGTAVQSWGDGFRQGIGTGIWQGIYYWLEQQQVARGGQPWYYYLLLIPLYEQLALVFGLAGLVYSLFHPTRFRIFLVWWFVASLFIYSWAAEKMPWLSIHILLPLMLLAAIALERVLVGVVALARRINERRAGSLKPITPWMGLAPAALVLALLLLIPTVFGMYELSHPDAASGPNEMMVYVQTTPDVTHVMREIAYADQVLYHGQHKLRIGVGAGQEWPWYWYLRDYTNVYWQYQAGSKTAPAVDVLILGPAGDPAASGQDAGLFMATHKTGWQMKEYRLRAWWSEDYKPQPCIATAKHPCPLDSGSWGVGLGNYLTYGSYPPQAGAHFQPVRAWDRVWNWVWTRQPLGDPHGSTDFVFIVHDGLPIHP